MNGKKGLSIVADTWTQEPRPSTKRPTRPDTPPAPPATSTVAKEGQPPPDDTDAGSPWLAPPLLVVSVRFRAGHDTTPPHRVSRRTSNREGMKSHEANWLALSRPSGAAHGGAVMSVRLRNASHRVDANRIGQPVDRTTAAKAFDQLSADGLNEVCTSDLEVYRLVMLPAEFKRLCNRLDTALNQTDHCFGRSRLRCCSRSAMTCSRRRPSPTAPMGTPSERRTAADNMDGSRGVAHTGPHGPGPGPRVHRRRCAGSTPIPTRHRHRCG